MHSTTAGTRWAAAKDLGEGSGGDLRRAVRKRFGGTMAVLDYNGDGKLDLYLGSAVMRGTELTDLLLKNEGEGKFRDVTAEAGLVSNFVTLGVTIGDFDNEGRPDLLLTGPAGIALLHRGGEIRRTLPYSPPLPISRPRRRVASSSSPAASGHGSTSVSGRQSSTATMRPRPRTSATNGYAAWTCAVVPRCPGWPFVLTAIPGRAAACR